MTPMRALYALCARAAPANWEGFAAPPPCRIPPLDPTLPEGATRFAACVSSLPSNHGDDDDLADTKPRGLGREEPRSARSDRGRRRRRPHRFDAAVAARRRAPARERAADDVDPAEGARAEPEDDGDPGRRRRRGGDLREGHARREHARDGLVRRARRSRPRLRTADRADRVLGRRLHQSQLDGGEPVPLGQPSADPPGADLQGGGRKR